MYTLGIPREELVSFICEMGTYMVTKIQIDELMEKYGDLVKDGKVIRENKAREELYLSYTE